MHSTIIFIITYDFSISHEIAWLGNTLKPSVIRRDWKKEIDRHENTCTTHLAYRHLGLNDTEREEHYG
jgi:hypothetical protein